MTVPAELEEVAHQPTAQESIFHGLTLRGGQDVNQMLKWADARAGPLRSPESLTSLATAGEVLVKFRAQDQHTRPVLMLRQSA